MTQKPDMDRLAEHLAWLVTQTLDGLESALRQAME